MDHFAPNIMMTTTKISLWKMTSVPPPNSSSTTSVILMPSPQILHHQCYHHLYGHPFIIIIMNDICITTTSTTILSSSSLSVMITVPTPVEIFIITSNMLFIIIFIFGSLYLLIGGVGVGFLWEFFVLFIFLSSLRFTF